MVPRRQSCIAFLAAGLLWLCGVPPAHAMHAWPSDGVQNIPISTVKTRVGDFSFAASGRLPWRHELSPANTPGSRGCGYEMASGRAFWNEHDPNGMSFCGGDPVNGFDSNGKCVENAPPSLNITPTTPPPLFNADLSLNLSAMQPLDVSSLSPSLQNQSAFGLNYEATSTMIDSANLVYDVTGESRLASWTIGVGTMSAISPGSISLYNSGWATGNGYTKVIGTVGDISEYGGNILTGVGILYGGYNYANNRESGLQFGADTTVSVTAVGLSYSGLTIGGAEAGGPLGIALGGGYLAGGLINNYVPGVSGAAQTVFQPFMNAYYSPIYQATYDPNSIESNVNSVANPFP